MKGKFEEIIAGDQPVLVDVFAEWCGPCKMMGPILKEFKGTVGDRVRVIKIDSDKNPEIMLKFGIRGVPTLMLFQGGELKWRQSGVVQANQLVQVVDQFAA